MLVLLWLILFRGEPFTSLLLNSLILLHRFGGDGSGRFRAVVSLNIGGVRADCTPSLT